MGDGTAAGAHRRIRAAYVNVILDGRLAFRYDPWRGLVEVQHRGVKHVVDLAAIEAQEEQDSGADMKGDNL